MTQAARSGRVNIAEGSERASTSTETEMKLTDVARASLAELKNDYEFWLLSRRKLPWKVPSPEACEVLDPRLDPNPLGEGGGLHEADVYLLAQYDKFASWLNADDPDLVANALLLLIGRALNMLARQKEAQGAAFREEGGFRERLTAARLETRDRQEAEAGAPDCPDCGKPMRRRTARSGRRAGQPFWAAPATPNAKARASWKRRGVDALADPFGDRLGDPGPVFAVGDAKPAGVGAKDTHRGFAAADQPVDHRRNVAFGFEMPEPAGENGLEQGKESRREPQS